MRAYGLIGFTFWVLFSRGALAQSEITRYTIGMAGERVAHVHIEQTLSSTTLSISNRHASDGLSTADFISNVTLTNASGVSHMEADGQGNWSATNASVGERVEIDYDLSLDLGNHQWAHGREEIGFKLGDGAFLISRVTMLWDYEAPETQVEVYFEAEDSAAPWKSIGVNHWVAADRSAFLNNGFAFGGSFHRSISQTAEGEVTFIYDEASSDLARQAADDIEPSLRHTTEIFGDFPSSNYHIFLFENDRPEGGAYDDSFAMLHPVPAQRVDALLWRQGFIHEINHLWVGHQIRPAAGSDIEWFKEGVADYLAIKTMWKLGYIDDRGLEDKLENLLRRHTLGVFMSEGKVEMIKAGANKSQNLMIVYGSGASWAFMLDVEMSADQGPGSFEAMLADLYAHSEEPYTHERLMERINVTSNGAAGRLVELFNINLMPMAFPDMLEPYGIEIAFMIPDMFELDLNPSQIDGYLPAFLREQESVGSK